MLVKVTLKQLADRCIDAGYDFDNAYKSVVSRNGDILMMDTEHKTFPFQLMEAAEAERTLGPRHLEKEFAKQVLGEGVGTELKLLLSTYLGIRPSLGCKCMKRAKEMNSRGLEWCELNKERIVSWLREEAKNKKLPFINSVAHTVLNIAIWKYKRKVKL